MARVTRSTLTGSESLLVVREAKRSTPVKRGSLSLSGASCPVSLRPLEVVLRFVGKLWLLFSVLRKQRADLKGRFLDSTGSILLLKVNYD